MLDDFNLPILAPTLRPTHLFERYSYQDYSWSKGNKFSPSHVCRKKNAWSDARGNWALIGQMVRRHRKKKVKTFVNNATACLFAFQFWEGGHTSFWSAKNAFGGTSAVRSLHLENKGQVRAFPVLQSRDIVGATSRLAQLEKLSLIFSRSLFVIRLNLFHP